MSLFLKPRLSFELLLLFYLLVGINKSVAQAPTPFLSITQLTNNFYIFTTRQNYGGQIFPANGLYVVTNNGVVMIDTPWDTTQVEPLLDSIMVRHQKKVILCIATHYHDDRTGGFEILERHGVETWSSALTKLYCLKNNIHPASSIFLNDTILKIGDLTLETYYPGPAHTSDNIVIWFPSQKILYGGCMIKSIEAGTLGNLDDADVFSWGKSLSNVQKKFPHPAFVIPGHQDWNSKKSISHTLKLVDDYNKR